MSLEAIKPPKSRLNGSSRSVAIFDVLGIKAGIESGSSSDIAGRYSDLMGLIQHLGSAESDFGTALPRLIPSERFLALSPTVHVFSDTIILISKDGSFDAAARLLIMSWRIMQAFFSANLPLRGAIVFGEIHTDEQKQIYIGPALVRANELEKSQAWAGAIIDDSFMQRFPLEAWERAAGSGLFDIVFPVYAVPIKDGDGRIKTTDARTINWKAQLVRDVGFSKPALDYYGKRAVSDLHPYLVRAFAFAKSHGGYLGPQESIPVEFRTFWIGKAQPPFPSGPELW